MTKTILFLVIEGNGNKGCGGSGGEGQNQSRLLEKECELFLSRWYNPGINGEFSQIETYLICPSNLPPSSAFLKRVSERHPLVKYIHCPHKVSDTFPAGWFNTPLAGKWLEENVEYEKSIHLDLDMILLKKFNRNYLNFEEGLIAKCAVYHPDFPDDLAEMDGIEKKFVTCFVVSSKEGRFYGKWWEKQQSLLREYREKYSERLVPDNRELWWRYCNLEEHAVDKMFFSDQEKIGMIEYCQFGSAAGYGSIEENFEHIDKINFLHCHVDGNWKEQIGEYAKYKLLASRRGGKEAGE